MNQLIAAEFHGTTLNIIGHAGRRWLTADQVGLCLGYNEANAGQGIRNLYNRHVDEFTEADTCQIKLIWQGQQRDLRVFSSTGCIKLGFFANTARAKYFRAWAAKMLDGMPAIAPAQFVARGVCRITRRVERQMFELFAKGMRPKQIAEELAVSFATVSLMLHAKYQFSLWAGEPECTPELIAAVAARHLVVEREKLLDAQERIAQRFLSTTNNQSLAQALDAVGRQLLPGGAA